MLRILVLFMLFLTPCLSRAKAITSVEEGRGILQRITDKYKSARSYIIEGSMEMALMSKGVRMFSITVPFVIAGVYPYHCRFEMKNSAMGVIKVCDGEQTWTYFESQNKYMFGPYIALDTSSDKGALDALRPEAPPVFGVGLLSATPGGAIEDFEIVDEDTIMYSGQVVPCTVLQYRVPADGDESGGKDGVSVLVTNWIDPVRDLILKNEVFGAMPQDSSMAFSAEFRAMTSYTRISIDEAVPDSLFTFTPPDSAEFIEDVRRLLGQSEFMDKTLPSVNLHDAEGLEVLINDYKGKVVLLDFWATWCLPCRKELPHIQKLHEEYADEGLVVIGVSNESPETIRKFLQKHSYTFSILVDEESEACKALKVKSIPACFIIDEEGIVRDHLVGMQSESNLRSALRKVGIGGPVDEE